MNIVDRFIFYTKINTTYFVPTIAFFGHLDTSAELTNDTKAQVLPYNGGDLCLNNELNIYLRQSEFPELAIAP